MKRPLSLLLLLCLLTLQGISQSKPLTYYLPDIEYDPGIPTPEAYFGYQIGDWHLSHDRQYAYMRELAALSPRITLTEYARTYEQRPLIYLTVTSEENHQNLETIQAQHVQLTDPGVSGELNTAEMPLVIYQGYSIHGNEPSGGNAAALVAYYLAAGQSAEVQQLLDEVVILLDPCYNPDGFQRFSTWANMHKNQNLTGDSQDREYNEVWPRGRTNHYWFDLNRDWLLVQHPESQGRIETFHAWKPNILTDHHEMGTNSTFFFMPGEPQRTNPLTPPLNQELTAEIGKYHAAALDKIGSLYYSEEGYDDFYSGKGSTYPDANGAIGILFEQASSRGHLQETEHGPLTFPFTIRNQVTTALSTFEAGLAMRQKLLDFQRDFYRSGVEEEAPASEHKAYVFGEPNDRGRLSAFIEVLRRHQLEVYELSEEISADGREFEPGSAYIVPLEQQQYRMVEVIFDTITTFNDSLFYDVSTWTLPYAFNIPYARVPGNAFSSGLLGTKVEATEIPLVAPTPEAGDYAYLFEWDEYYAPKALQYLLENGIRAKVAMEPFTAKGHRFSPGAIMVAVANQEAAREELHQLMQIAARGSGVRIWNVDSGLTPEGLDLGSRDFEALREPKVLLIVGDGVSSYESGEVWHLLDRRYHARVTMIETDDIGGASLGPYNTIVMVDGGYGNISKSGVHKIKEWVQQGGTLIATKDAIRWVKDNELGYVAIEEQDEETEGFRPYGKLSEDRGADVIGGAIFEARLDLTHPLGFGFKRETLPVFRNHTLFFEPGQNPYATPLVYTEEPLLSGYVSDRNLDLLRNSAAAIVTGTGRGKVICLADNPNFRAFWYGTNKLFANALYFGHTISNRAREQKPKNSKPAVAGEE